MRSREVLIIVIILSLTILAGLAAPTRVFAINNDLVKEIKWDGKGYIEILESFEESFLSIYEFAEAEPESDRAFKAFKLLQFISKVKELKRLHKEQWLKSDKLNKELKALYTAIQIPQSARELFYKGLFVLLPRPLITSEDPELYRYFTKVIEDYPDTIYAEYSYIFLAESYIDNGRKEAEAMLSKYLLKYGSHGRLSYYVYYLYATLPYNIHFLNTPNALESDKRHVRLMFKYTNKFLNEFSKKKELAGHLTLRLGNYYLFQGDYGEALQNFYKVYNNPEHNRNDLYSAMFGIIKIHKIMKEPEKLDKFLEDIKYSYPSDRIVGGFYIRNKRKGVEW